MPTLDPNSYAYLWNPTRQMLDKNGKPLVGGYVMLNMHGTTGVPALSYSDWNGTLNARQILLDNLGRASAIVENDKQYDLYVYNRWNVLQYSALGVNCEGEAGAGILHFTSSDGSVIIERSGNTVDFRVNKDTSTYGSAEADSVSANGLIEFDTVGSGDITVVSAGTLRIERGKLYHVTVALEFNTTTVNPLYCDCQLQDSENTTHKFTLDASRTKQMIELSWDAVSTANIFQLFIQAPSIFTVTSADLYIHSVDPVVGGSSGGAGVEEVELTQEALTARFGTIADLYNELEDGKQFLFVYNDNGLKELYNIESWNRTSHPYYNVTLTKNEPTNWFTIKEKFCSISENFSLYFYDTYSYKFDPHQWIGACPDSIPAGTYAAGNIIAVKTTSEGGQGIWAPVELYQCILGYTEAGLHHPKLDTTHWKQVYLKDLLNEFQDESAQADWNVTDSSSPAYIKNKPDLSLYALIADLAAVAFSGDYDDLANKPDLSVFARTTDLAPVAFSGSYSDLSNVPAHLVQDASYVHTDNNFTNSLKDKLDGIASGAEVNVQPDWNQTNSSADDYIKNKPSIPPAQVQSDWEESDTTDPSYIQNKPVEMPFEAGSNISFSVQNNKLRVDCTAQAVPDSTAQDEGKVLTVDGTGNPKWDDPPTFTQQQSDWNQSNSSAVDYIKNKPSVPVIGTVEL